MFLLSVFPHRTDPNATTRKYIKKSISIIWKVYLQKRNRRLSIRAVPLEYDLYKMYHNFTHWLTHYKLLYDLLIFKSLNNIRKHSHRSSRMEISSLQRNFWERVIKDAQHNLYDTKHTAINASFILAQFDLNNKQWAVWDTRISNIKTKEVSTSQLRCVALTAHSRQQPTYCLSAMNHISQYPVPIFPSFCFAR